LALGLGACASAGLADEDASGDDGTPPPIDAGRADAPEPITPPDAALPKPDASLPPPVDAAVPKPDAPLPPPVDAAVPKPDATVPPPDAAPPPPDAAVPGDVCTAAAQQPKSDTCAQAIDLTNPAKTAAGAVAYGNTTGYANQVPEAPTSCTDSFNEDGVDAIYKVTLPGGKTLSATVEPIGWDAAVYIVQNACTNSQPCVAGNDEKGAGAAESATFTAAANMGGTYYIYVDSHQPASYGSGYYGCFTLRVKIQ
jgi:hypothetical protein